MIPQASGGGNPLLATLDLDATASTPSASLQEKADIVKKWITDHAVPDVGILTPRSFSALYRMHRPLLIAFVEGDLEEPAEVSPTTSFTERAAGHYRMLRQLVNTESEDLGGLTVVIAEAKQFVV